MNEEKIISMCIAKESRRMRIVAWWVQLIYVGKTKDQIKLWIPGGKKRKA